MQNNILIFGVFIVFGLLFFSFFNQLLYNEKEYENSCRELPSITEKILCHEEQARKAREDGGIEAMITYVTKEVREDETYNIMHMILHDVGHFAYYDAGGDIQKAFSYLSAKIVTSEDYVAFDGYQHGVLHSFFYEEQENHSMPDLMRASCNEYFDSESYGILGSQCFHSVGHALMYSNENDVFISLSYCKDLPYKDSRQNCYYGTFMEHAYLYSPVYNRGAPRPRVDRENIFSICPEVEADQKSRCFHLASMAYFIIYPGDYKGVLEFCNSLEDAYQATCVERVATLRFPNYFKGNPEKLAELCNYAGKHEGLCLKSIATGIRMGTAGLDNTDLDFCSFVQDESLAQECRGFDVYYFLQKD